MYLRDSTPCSVIMIKNNKKKYWYEKIITMTIQW